ncbi:MAG: hypothetical protein EBU81_03650 [Proteobacteria bacterium]|nr:hypothetical protein [Pseudomonadota bacterium]
MPNRGATERDSVGSEAIGQGLGVMVDFGSGGLEVGPARIRSGSVSGWPPKEFPSLLTPILPIPMFPMSHWSALALVAASLTALPLVAEVPRHPKFGFPVYTNAPSGRQLSGQHKPADNPAYSPEDAPL